MLIFNAHYRKFGLRRFQELLKPRLATVDTLELPKESILHYLPNDEVELGISSDDPILSSEGQMVFVNHNLKLTSEEGKPRSNRIVADSMVRDYHKRYRKLRRLKKLEAALRNGKTLLVENYALLGHLYRYTPSVYSNYYKWYNISATLWNRIGELAKDTERQHFIIYNLPEQLPTLADLRKAEGNLSKASLEPFKASESLQILDLWRWIADPSNSSMKNIDVVTQSRINIIFLDGNRWFTVNLSVISEGIKGDGEGEARDPGLAQKYLLKSLMTLMEARTGGGNFTVDDTAAVQEVIEEDGGLTNGDVKLVEEEISDLELEAELNSLVTVNEKVANTNRAEVQLNIEKDASIDEYIDEQINALADSGLLSGAEFRRLERLNGKYKTIKNPFGEGSLKDLVAIDPNSLKVGEKIIVPDTPEILDKSMLKSSVADFDAKYIEEVMQKDIAGMATNVQKAGVILSDYKVTEVRDAVSHYNAYSVQFTPLSGTPTTVRFRLPVVHEDGTYIANGVKARFRKQRGDVPIRKVSPSRVALTSYYGKTFVDRSERSTNNPEKWLLNQLVAMGIDDANSAVTDIELVPVFDHLLEVPRIYSTLAKRTRALKVNGIQLYVDYKTREAYFGKDTVAKVEKDGFVIIGKKRGDLYVVDGNSTFYKHTDKGPEVIGDFVAFSELELKTPPSEMAELKVFNKAIPVGLALAYLLGLDSLLHRLKSEPRRANAGERLNLAPDEYAVKFADETLVFGNDDPILNMLMAGFNRYKREIRQYSIHEFNRKDVYLNVLEAAGIQVRYIKELDLMAKLFIDHITKELLEEMGEPTNFIGLLLRSCELLLTDHHPKENDMAFQRIKGYERMSGAVYGELIRAMRVFNAKPVSARNKVDLNPHAVWMNVMTDPAAILVEELNPIHNLKEKEIVTFVGNGGRSARSMVDRTRTFGESDVGVISEGTPDSGDVAVTTYLTPDANFTSLRGITSRFDHDNVAPTKLVSTSALLSPSSDIDDPKRVNFAGIQHSQTTFSDGYVPSPLRTGYERIIPHRVDSNFAYTAKQGGKVLEVSDSAVTVQYKDGSEVTLPIGKEFGKAAGVMVPHELVANVKAGDKVSEGDCITYNSNYFVPDGLNPKEVIWKAGMLVKTALLESPDTLEDSSAISQKVADNFTTRLTKVKSIRLRFDQTVRNLLKAGTVVDVDSILCNIEDPVTADNDLFDDESLNTLNILSNLAPKAKVEGVIERVEVFYNGDKEDMSESLLKLVNASDRDLMKRSKARDGKGVNGQVDNSLRIDGVPLELDNLVINIYITTTISAGVGDKGVFANQLKTVFGRVMTGVNRTESGEDLDAFFGFNSIAARIVNSPITIGTTNTLLKVLSKKVVDAYNS